MYFEYMYACIGGWGDGGPIQEIVFRVCACVRAAAAAEERVIILCHVILHPLACGGGTMCWDYDQALETIASEEAAGCVAAARSRSMKASCSLPAAMECSVL